MQASPFDEMAAGYDESFTHTACATVLRGLVWRQLRTALAGRGTVLELGCGTGEDAVHLARAGHRVVATDASPEMIRVAQAKALAAGCADRIEFHVLPMESLHALPPSPPFDGAFSNFGAINCVADLPRLGACLAERLRPGAPLLLVALGRCVPWEWFWFGLRGQPRKAFRRLQSAGVAWRGTTVLYPSPTRLAALLAADFEAVRRRALGSVLPPSYAAGWLDRRPRLLAALARLERWGQRIPALASLADHYVLEARRLP
jgi:SAM-dependent methyltransferase